MKQIEFNTSKVILLLTVRKFYYPNIFVFISLDMGDSTVYLNEREIFEKFFGNAAEFPLHLAFDCTCRGAAFLLILRKYRIHDVSVAIASEALVAAG